MKPNIFQARTFTNKTFGGNPAAVVPARRMAARRNDMSGEVKIRRAERQDAADVSQILLESFSTFREFYTPEAFEVVTPRPEVIIDRCDEGPVWIAAVNGKPAGTVSVLHEPDWLYIRSMAVTPEARGLGIADELMAAVEKYAVRKGFNRLFLYTTYFSTGAIELYEKHGFKRGRDTTADEWHGTPGLAMEKSLDRSFIIREVLSEDIGLLSEVATTAYLEHFRHLWTDNGEAYAERSFNVKELSRQLSDEANCYFMAFSSGDAVGFLKIRPDRSLAVLKGANALEIERIYLIRAAKGKGIGKAMVKFALDLACEMDKETVWLKVMDTNPESIGFYESCGFQIVATETLDLPLLKREYAGMFVMKKDLRN